MWAVPKHRPVGNTLLDRLSLDTELIEAAKAPATNQIPHVPSLHVWREIPCANAEFLVLEVAWMMKIFLGIERSNNSLFFDEFAKLDFDGRAGCLRGLNEQKPILEAKKQGEPTLTISKRMF